MDGMKAYKLSLALDCVCILIAVAILYCANKALLPTWGLVAGAVTALGFLVAAIILLGKARRSFKQQAQVARKQEDEQKEEQETEE